MQEKLEKYIRCNPFSISFWAFLQAKKYPHYTLTHNSLLTQLSLPDKNGLWVKFLA